jgi:CRISPR/Cas system CSM-associated protein Csm3 (group 7 of RAMP superfamily)
MSRRIAARLKIQGELVADGPFHVGGMGGNPDVDLALAVDGKNRFYIPGTSIAGPLRAWASARLVDGDEVERLFGFQKNVKDKQTNQERDQGHASFILVEDGLVKSDFEVELRDGVGINRFTGAAAEAIKYDRAVLPHGSRIDFKMTVEIDPRPDEQREVDIKRVKKLIGSLLRALQDGQIHFGAARTRGLGKLKLSAVSLEIFEHDFLSPAGIIASLRPLQGSLELNDLGQTQMKDWPRLEIKITWRPLAALMVKAEREGSGVDMLPLTSASGEKLSFVLPGSSIKGALRTQAERIVRTVRPAYAYGAPSEGNPRKLFLDQVEMKSANAAGQSQGEDVAATQLIGALFGRASRKEGPPSGHKDELNDREQDKDKPPLAGLGALAAADCYAKPQFTRQQWANVEQAAAEVEQGKNKSPLQDALESAGLTHDPPTKKAYTQMAMHVAIDRWTGGAADRFLFSSLEPHGVEWNDIRLSLDLGRLTKDDRHPAVALLLLVLRDLTAGRIPLGSAVNRGMGAIEISRIKLTPEGLGSDDGLKCLADVKIEKGRIVGFTDALNNAWANWVKSQEAAAQSEERNER